MYYISITCICHNDKCFSALIVIQIDCIFNPAPRLMLFAAPPIRGPAVPFGTAAFGTKSNTANHKKINFNLTLNPKFSYRR